MTRDQITISQKLCFYLHPKTPMINLSTYTESRLSNFFKTGTISIIFSAFQNWKFKQSLTKMIERWMTWQDFPLKRKLYFHKGHVQYVLIFPRAVNSTGSRMSFSLNYVHCYKVVQKVPLKIAFKPDRVLLQSQKLLKRTIWFNCDFLLITLKFSMACERNLYHANRFPAYPAVSYIN